MDEHWVGQILEKFWASIKVIDFNQKVIEADKDEKEVQAESKS